jgi:hypothetical protein
MADEEAPKTTVVHVNDPGGFEIYIGRAVPRRGLPTSRWANHFKIGQDGTRAEVIAKYRARLRATPVLLSQLADLRGKRLGCWCKPLACHGDVLAELADALP